MQTMLDRVGYDNTTHIGSFTSQVNIISITNYGTQFVIREQQYYFFF